MATLASHKKKSPIFQNLCKFFKTHIFAVLANLLQPLFLLTQNYTHFPCQIGFLCLFLDLYTLPDHINRLQGRQITHGPRIPQTVWVIKKIARKRQVKIINR